MSIDATSTGSLTSDELAFFQREGYLIPSRPLFPPAKFDALRRHFEEKVARLPVSLVVLMVIRRNPPYKLAFNISLFAVELCSLTIQRDDLSMANLIASGLFGDGAAAVLLMSGGTTGGIGESI